VARFAQGAPVRLSTEVKDATGAYATPGTILLRVKKPDGTFLPDYTSPTADAAGKYHQDIAAADANTLGHYQYAWITTGTAAGVSPPAAFEVVDAFAPTHITWSDVLEQLGLTDATLSAGKQAELQRYMASAVAEQEQRVGAVAPRQVTDTVTAYGGRLWLPTRPVLSVVSATFAGLTVSVADWRVGPPMAGYVASMSSPLAGEYVVTYTAGRQPVPQDLVEAALLRVQHSYESQRGPGEAAFGEVADGGIGSSPFRLLLQAQDKEKPYVLPTVA
jgi:hypothetical protein